MEKSTSFLVHHWNFRSRGYSPMDNNINELPKQDFISIWQTFTRAAILRFSELHIYSDVIFRNDRLCDILDNKKKSQQSYLQAVERKYF